MSFEPARPVAEPAGPQVLQRLVGDIERSRAAGHEPMVVLDLDGTLYNNSLRTLRILQEFAHRHARRYPVLQERVATLPAEGLEYAVEDTLARLGITEPGTIAEVREFWFARFFIDDYVGYDLPVAGAVELVGRLHAAGAVPVYLTGRDAPHMLVGTIRALQRDGFPVGTLDTRIILKDRFERADLEFKTSVVDHLRRLGEVVGAFDNEPGLCNLMKESFPHATVLWLDTCHARGAPPLRPDIPGIRDFAPLLGE